MTLSICCLAPIAVAGRTGDGQTRWYECSACHCPVDGRYHHVAERVTDSTVIAMDGHDDARR